MNCQYKKYGQQLSLITSEIRDRMVAPGRYAVWQLQADRYCQCHASHRGTLTHWGRNKMAAIILTTFSNEFSGMKMYDSRLKFHWSLFPGAQLTIFQQWLRKWLPADQATNHYLNHWWLFYWRIRASLGLDESNGQFYSRNSFAMEN